MDDRVDIFSVLNIMTETITDKYLGLHAQVSVQRFDCFQDLIDRVCKRLAGYREKILSYGGKEVLMKAMANYPYMCDVRL